MTLTNTLSDCHSVQHKCSFAVKSNPVFLCFQQEFGNTVAGLTASDKLYLSPEMGMPLHRCSLSFVFSVPQFLYRKIGA